MSSSSSCGLVTGLLCEKPLELGAELVSAGQILIARQQRPVLLSGDERIVLSLQCLHHLSDFAARLDLFVDLVVHFGGGLRQRGQRDLQRAALGDLGQQRLGGRRVVGLGQIVRDVHGEPDHLVTVLGHPELQQVRHAAGHLHLTHPRRVVGDQLLVVGVRRHRDRAGVRHRHRDGAQPDHLPHAEPFGQQPHRGDEPLPAQVRLHAREQQKRCPDAVVQGVQVQLGFLVVGEVVGLERHQRPPRPVVQQFVDGERRHQLGVQRVLQVLGGQPDRVPGVREALQGVDHHRPAAVRRGQLRRGELQLVHPGLVGLVVLLWFIGVLSHRLASWHLVSRTSLDAAAHHRLEQTR